MYTVAMYLIIARCCSVTVFIYYVDLFAEYLLACMADHDFYNIIHSTANIHTYMVVVYILVKHVICSYTYMVQPCVCQIETPCSMKYVHILSHNI